MVGRDQAGLFLMQYPRYLITIPSLFSFYYLFSNGMRSFTVFSPGLNSAVNKGR